MTTHHLSLRELLRMADDGPVSWISGETKAGEAIQWVSLDTGDIQPGDALLLLSADLNPELIRDAEEKKASALILLGEAPSLEEAPSINIPVAAIPGRQGLRATHRLLLTTLINQHTVLMERGVRIHAQFSQLVAEGHGLAGLAKAIAEISGHGVLLQDKRLDTLAFNPSSTLRTTWEGVLEQLKRVESLPEPLRDRKRAGLEGTIVNQPIPGELERMVAPVIVGGVVRGYLSLVAEKGEFDALDHLVIEQGAQVCAVEMARKKAVRETEKRLKGDLLTALLQEDLSSGDAHLWVQDMGLDLEQAHTALRFAWDTTSPPSRRRLETLVNGEIAHQDLKVIVNPMGVEVVCFCQVPSDASRPEAALSLGRAVLDQAAREFSDAPARCGVGSPAGDLSDWRTSFRQAGQALEMARRLGNPNPLYFPDLSVYRLLLQIEHKPELMAFQEEILGPLLAYEGSEELIRTLEAFFDNHGNLSQTAESLFIHRNTLLYRMERIAEISSLDLDNPETRLAVQLALRIHNMTVY